jgi:hypothetical protein
MLYIFSIGYVFIVKGKQVLITSHTKEFLKIIASNDPYIGIRTITHSNPLLVFWVDQNCKVIDAFTAHHKNPPNGDRSILVDQHFKGYLRGRAAMFGSKLYIVIYGTDQFNRLTKRQQALLDKSRLNIVNTVSEKSKIDTLDYNFVDEFGNII